MQTINLEHISRFDRHQQLATERSNVTCALLMEPQRKFQCIVIEIESNSSA